MSLLHQGPFDKADKAAVKFKLRLCQFAKDNVFLPVWQLALLLHLLFSAAQNVFLNQRAQFFSGLPSGFLLKLARTGVASFKDDLTKLFGEELKLSQ